ncbi:hypothetical protein BV25DRAFT_1829689 [Artomyces pyxidatus]|uniref:Uncharacterized protein n=1 Tax=Artomyces pyxidatus TaxID=48021 RepID=A0ACB8SQR7_9AGAM|nr:hypothetical protein BV25DRAFT_1829689 [Artomyces pyxidatus]
MSTSAKLILPIYQAAPYSFSGLAFTELPCIVQLYLANTAHVTPPTSTIPDADDFARLRSQLASTVFRALQGIDIALVEKRREARQFAHKAKVTVEELADARAKDEERVLYIMDVLLPERAVVLDEFIAKLDGLVWLELEAAYAKEGRDTLEAQQQYRTETINAPLDYIHRALVALDDAVIQRDEEARTPVDGVARVPWRNSVSSAELDKSIEVLREQIAKLTIRKIELLNGTEKSVMSDVRNTLGRRAEQPWRPRGHSVSQR